MAKEIPPVQIRKRARSIQQIQEQPQPACLSLTFDLMIGGCLNALQIAFDILCNVSNRDAIIISKRRFLSRRNVMCCTKFSHASGGGEAGVAVSDVESTPR
jgi:hypothetical protein